MIISSSHISTDASSGHTDVNRTAGSQEVYRNHRGLPTPHFRLDLPELSLSPAASSSSRLEASHHSSSTVAARGNNDEVYESEAVISRLLEALAGGKPRLRDLPPEQRFGPILGDRLAPDRAMKRSFRIGGRQFSLSIASHRVSCEYEYMDFNSTGEVITADGRSISFSLDLSLRRTSVVRQSVLAHVAAGTFIDPLVLTFENGLETLAEHSFLFDLDSDGSKERIPGLASGSGFLALDIDGDRRIANGTELFGPASGSGFADLAVHDRDGNNWIDENDPIFSRLLVWRNPGDGEQELVSLEEAGIGAIGLSHGATRFDLKSPEDQVLGTVTAAGVFLTEAGEVKPLQDITLASGVPGQTASPEAVHRGSGGRRVFQELQDLIASRRRRLAALVERSRFGARRRSEDEEKRWRLLLPELPAGSRRLG